MRIKFVIIILLIFLALIFSCEEEFKPEIYSSSVSLIVVDGMISNLPGPYTVKLSLSSKIENPEYIPLSGFKVFILDDQGQSTNLAENYTGNYVSTDQSFTGIPGRSYKISLFSPDGKTYESDFVMLREPTGIASIDHKVEFTPNKDLIYDIAGYRFYVNTELAPSDTNYYLWQLISTYKYTADFNIYWMYDGFLSRIYNSDTLKICYKTDIVPEFFLLNTENINPPVVGNFPLHYVTTETRELMERYSLLVRQYSISKSAYTFWEIIKDQNTNLGNLYSKQPFQVRGNIYNTEFPDEVVLGHFMVAGISEKRIFVDKPGPPVKMRFPVCELHEDNYRNFGAIFESPPTSWPVFATVGPEGNALPNQWCMDCRESGGQVEKPDFWIDK